MPRHVMGRRHKTPRAVSRAPTWRTFAAPRPTPRYADRLSVDGNAWGYEVLTPELVTWKLDRWQLTHG